MIRCLRETFVSKEISQLLKQLIRRRGYEVYGTALVLSFDFVEVLLHSRDRPKLAQEGVCVELLFIEVVCIFDRVVDIGDCMVSIMRVSAEKELEQCARETRILEETY